MIPREAAANPDDCAGTTATVVVGLTEESRVGIGEAAGGATPSVRGPLLLAAAEIEGGAR